MDGVWSAALWLCWLVVGWWGLASLVAILNRVMVPRLSDDGLPDAELPLLSVVIPARNEEADLEEALRSHLEQDYPGLEVVVCDDGSTDQTPEILARMLLEFPSLTVVQGGEVRPGWLGKPNAQRQALEVTHGKCILFVDADVIYSRGAHRRAVSELVRHEADMLLLLGTLEAKGLEPLVLSFLNAFAIYCGPLFLANVSRLRSVAFGGGIGNLVTREALEGIGGLEVLRSEVVDDVAMGQRMKAWRGRYRLVAAPDAVRVRMYRGFSASFQGFTKNLYSAFGRRLWLGSASFGLDLSVHTLPSLFLALSFAFPALQPLRLPTSIAVLAGIICNAAAAIWTGTRLWTAVTFPLRSVIWTAMFLRSAWIYRTRGIVWRGRAFR